MAVKNLNRGVAYGLSDSLLNVFPAPIASTRNPSSGDRAQLGTVWVNKSTNDFFILTSVTANVSTWSSPSNGSGIFADLEATTGDITADLGNFVATAGSVIAENNIIANSGNIVAATGEINATAGGLTVATDITTTTGDIIATLGSVLVSNGNISVTAGNVTVTAGDITAVNGDIEASAGALRGEQVEAAGDLGGLVGTTAITNVVNNTQGAGALTLLSTNGNAGTNAGFLKIYVGATTAYVPYFTTIAP
jgi:hypothetical protein